MSGGVTGPALGIAGPNYNLGGGAPSCKIYFYNDYHWPDIYSYNIIIKNLNGKKCNFENEVWNS